MGRFLVKIGNKLISFNHKVKCKWNALLVRMTIKCTVGNCKCYEE